jgi:HEAT repeat protein
MFMALGVLTSFIGLSYATGMGRFDRGAYLSALLFGAAVVLVIERAAIWFNPLAPGAAANEPGRNSLAPYPIVWLTVYVLNVLLSAFLWNVAGQVCDARQAKRLFSFFASAGILGGVLGNLLTGLLARTLGTENLLVLYGALLLVGFALIRAIARQFFRRDVKRAAAVSLWEDLRVGFDVVRTSRLMQLIAYASVLFSILFFSTSFSFSKIVSASFAEEADVAGFLGLFSSAITAITFLTSLLIANRLYARLGVANAVLILPVVYLAGFVLWALHFDLTTAVIARAAQMVILVGVASTAWNAFFNVVCSEKRSQVQTFQLAVPSQIGVVASGVFLILGERVPNTMQIFVMGMVAAIFCGMLVWQMRTAYGVALVDALRTGLADVFTDGPRGFRNLGMDANARRTALAGLADPKPTVRRASAEILGKLQVREAVEPLVLALRDPDPDVRGEALDALRFLNTSEAVEPVAACLSDPVPAVRARAINALGVLASESAHEWTCALNDPDPVVRGRAVAAFCRLGDATNARAGLAALLDSPNPSFRIAGLTSLSECHDGAEAGRIAGFVNDASVGVRLAAVQALGVMGDGNAVAPLLQALDDPDERVRFAAGKSLQSIESASEALVDLLREGSERAQDAALVALQNHSRAAREAAVDWALAQIPRAAQYRGWSAALERADGDGTRSISFLRDLLRDREWQTEQRILHALALVGTAEATRQEATRLIERGLKSGHQEERAQALEALDTLGDKRIARALVPLLEDGSSGSLEESRQVLKSLTSQADLWLRALATHAMGEMLSRDLKTLATRAQQDPAAIVRQAAVEAIRESPVSMGDSMADSVKTLGTMERILFLREVPIFGNLTPEDLAQIADLSSERVFEDGDYLCREGELGDELFVIVEGQVCVAKQSDGSMRTLRTLRAGEQVGELAILREQPRSASVIAQGSHVRALVLRGDALQAILRDRPQVAMAMLSSLAERLTTNN